ncbi:MAG TPA: universal stress protein [Gammaproteobacteria bacterium]|nr:universal stress protein [Gammaproteobacteria bacterium]
MRAYQHILAAVDLSPEGRQVLERAQDLAQRYGSALSLIHVIEPLPVDAAGEALLPPMSIESELHENAEHKLNELADQAGLERTRRHVVMGYTKREIIGFAEEKNVDLIVVGSHGRHGLALLLGSTANAVLHGAPCDVLAVRI